MKKTAVLLAAMFVLLAAHGLAVAEESKTLTGEYVWSSRDSGGELEAVFTPTGKGTFDVSFHFEFRGEPHTYTGTAEGSLTEGALKGTVQNEDKRRTWNFTGSFKEGAFNGTHEETTGDSKRATGTLTLKG